MTYFISSVDFTSKPLSPIASARCSCAACQNGVRRLLDAEVHYLIAVVAENDVHQVLADVVHVALDGGENHGSLLRALNLLHLGLQVGDCGLHHRGRVEHRGKLHLAGAKQVADGAHAVQQHVIDQLQRRVTSQRRFQQLLQALFAGRRRQLSFRPG